MRIARRLLAAAMCALAALAMCVGLAGTAWGDETGDGSITINNAVKGQTYNVYRIFDLESYNPTEGSEAYSYKVADKWQNFFDANYAGTNGRQWVDIDDQGYVTWKTGENAQSAENVQAFAKAALAWAKDNSIKVDADAQTASGTMVKFSDLDLGYYLVDSSLGALCALDTTNPAAEVNDKNDKALSVEKWIVETGNEGEVLTRKNDAAIGDKVTFRAVVTGQNLGAQVFTFHDKMDSGFTFDKDCTVTLNKGAGDEAVTLEKNKDYTFTTAKDGCSFELEFKGTQPFANASETITIEYTATVNAGAAIRDNGNANIAFVTYGDGPVTSEKSETTTMVWSFGVEKYTMKNTEKVLLAGATFELRKGSDKSDAIPFTAGEDNDYKYTPTAGEGTDTKIITTETGKFTISGLDSGTYYLTEVKAPNGYNALKAAIEVTISPEGKVLYDGKDATDMQVPVENNTGTELPSTGGMGTTVIYVAGGLLVAAAVVLLVAKKKMSADDK